MCVVSCGRGLSTETSSKIYRLILSRGTLEQDSCLSSYDCSQYIGSSCSLLWESQQEYSETRFDFSFQLIQQILSVDRSV